MSFRYFEKRRKVQAQVSSVGTSSCRCVWASPPCLSVRQVKEAKNCHMVYPDGHGHLKATARKCTGSSSMVALNFAFWKVSTSVRDSSSGKYSVCEVKLLVTCLTDRSLYRLLPGLCVVKGQPTRHGAGSFGTSRLPVHLGDSGKTKTPVRKGLGLLSPRHASCSTACHCNDRFLTISPGLSPKRGIKVPSLQHA